MKRIDEILHDLVREIEMNYGISDAVQKITVSHDAFDKMVLDMVDINKYTRQYLPSKVNDFEIYGVRIQARKKPFGDQ